jgi:hypothetical protein
MWEADECVHFMCMLCVNRFSGISTKQPVLLPFTDCIDWPETRTVQEQKTVFYFQVYKSDITDCEIVVNTCEPCNYL